VVEFQLLIVRHRIAPLVKQASRHVKKRSWRAMSERLSRKQESLEPSDRCAERRFPREWFSVRRLSWLTAAEDVFQPPAGREFRHLNNIVPKRSA
jgi:hypothetical protein